MAKLGLVPSRVLLLDAADRVCIERLTLQRIDPVNQDIYHLKSNPPTAAIAKRLVQNPKYQETIVRATINNFRTGKRYSAIHLGYFFLYQCFVSYLLSFVIF